MTELPLAYQLFIWSIPVLFAITLHEAGHGWVASMLGDNTAKDLGRLTVNPIKHIHPFGTVLLPIITFYLGGFIFGFAKPVPVNWRNLKNIKRDMILVALAGPVANLFMMLFWLFITKLFIVSADSGDFVSYLFVLMGFIGIMINLFLLILNLLPIPPLDGSRVVFSLLPDKLAHHYNKIERFGLLIVVILLITLLKTGILERFINVLQIYITSLV